MMIDRHFTASLVLVLVCIGALAGAAGCKKTASVRADGGADASADAKGLADPTNAPVVVALAKAAAACPKDKPEAHFRALLDPDCPAMKAWDRNELIARSANDPTLLDMLDDSDPTVRWLAASALFSGGETWGSDKASALRVIGATETEKDKFVGYKLGLATGMIDLKKTGLADRVIALIKDPSRDPWLRGGVFNTLGYNDPAKFPAVREAIEGVARKDDDASLRGSALQDLGMHKASINCPLFLEFIHDPEDPVSSAAVHGVSSTECAEQHEGLIVETLRRAKAGEASDTFAWSLGELGKAPDTTPAMKARLVAASQEIVKNPKNSMLARSRSLEVMVKLDPTTKSFAAKYRDDSNAVVAAAAKKVAPP